MRFVMSQEKKMSVLKQILDAVKRFPVAFGMILFYTVYLIVFALHGLDGMRSNVVAFVFEKWLIFYPILGVLLSISIKLYQENTANCKRWISLLLHGIVFDLSFFLALFVNDLSEDKFAQLLLTGIVILVSSVFFVANSKLKNGKRMANFQLKSCGAFVSALVFAAIYLCFFVVSVACLEIFFGWKVDKDVLLAVALFIFGFIMPMMFFARFPYLHQCEEKVKIKKIDKVIYYVLGALTLLYFLGLYVYMAKILFTWTLPQGTVVYAVSVAAIAAIYLYWVSYVWGYCDDDAPAEKTTLLRLCRLLLKNVPAITFPLLVLMTVAIARRIFDYGLTVPRFYVIALNVYFYMLFAELLKSKNVGRISTSDICGFVFLVLLCFVPFSKYSTDGFHLGKGGKAVEANQTKKFYFNSLSRSVMPTPPGYSSVVYVSRNLSPENVKLQNDTISFRLYYGIDSFKDYNGEGDEDVQFAEFRMPTSVLLDSARYFRKQRQEKLGTPLELKSENSVFFLTVLELMENTKDSMAVVSTVEGILFLK